MRKLSKNTKSRKHLLRDLAKALFKHGKITTTLCRAKEVRPFAERIITAARVDSLHNRRKVLAKLNNNTEIVKILFNDIGKNNKDRNGGYTSIVRVGIGLNGETRAQIRIISQCENKATQAVQ